MHNTNSVPRYCIPPCYIDSPNRDAHHTRNKSIFNSSAIWDIIVPSDARKVYASDESKAKRSNEMELKSSHLALIYPQLSRKAYTNKRINNKWKNKVFYKNA